MTLLNYWHYITLVVIFFIFIGGIFASTKQKDKKLMYQMLFTVTLISILLAAISIMVVDKYTKVVTLSKFENKRLLSTEQIIYTGIVKNEGKHTIGTVKLEIKLLNQGRASGKSKMPSMFAPSGFFDFFRGGADVLYKPQTVTEEFVVAKNLRAGEAVPFRVYFKFPPYFRNVSQFESVSGH